MSRPTAKIPAGATAPLLLALAVLGAGCTLSWFAARASQASLQADVLQRFHRRVDGLQGEVGRRIGRAEYGLRSLAATHAVAGGLDDRLLSIYVQTRDMQRDFAGLRGFGLVERVPREALPGYLAARRVELGAYQVRTWGEQPDLLLVRSIQPLPAEGAVLGFDAGADPSRRAAIEEAIATGRPTLSSAVALVDDERGRPGWEMYMPVYNGSPRTASERRAALRVVLFVPLVAEEVLGPVSAQLSEDVAFRLWDGEAGSSTLMHDGVAPWQSTSTALETETALRLGGRELTLEVVGTGRFLDQVGNRMPWAVGLGGGVLAVLLAVLTWVLAAGKVRAAAHAARAGADARRLASIVEAARGAVFATDTLGRITWANGGAADMAGRSKADLIGEPVIDVLGLGSQIPPARRAEVRDRLVQGHSEQLELEGRRPDGSAFWADVSLRPERDPDGRVTGFMGVAVDISRRKQAERRLEAREHLLRTITDNIPARISSWDREGRCRFANRRMLEVYGLPTGTPSEAIPSAPLDDTRVREVLLGMPQQFEQTLVEPDGRESSWQVHYLPDSDGTQVDGWFVLAHEITELRRTRDVALAASQAKSRFLSSMSHEIRTPMNAILGMLMLLRSSALTPVQEDYAGKAQGAARSLLSLLNDILDFSKIEAGKMQLSARPFSLEQMLADLSVILAAGVGDKPIDVLYDLDAQVPDALVGDDMRLRQVLINLGGNAVKFTSAGEVVLATRLVDRTPQSATVEFSVRDSGIGMSREEQDRLFGDFSQASEDTARNFGGTGLGLAICRRLADLMESELLVESESGRGTRFWFQVRLPLAAEPVLRAPPPAPVERVLVVDDNDVARQSLAGLAASQGWRVDVAASGREALERAAAASVLGEPYHAVFMDWRMPGMDGWEASQRLRALTGRDATLVIMVSAQGRDMLQRKPPQEQQLLDGFLVKPVTAAMLRAAVTRPTSPVAPPDAAADRPLAGLRLLLAEDNPVNQQIACELIGGLGAEIDVAENGRIAVDRLAAGERYDAVLMDVMMPVMNGLEATQRIRRELGLATLPIVAMTANAMDNDKAECMAAGMDGHVGKPVVLEELVRTLQECLARTGGPRVAQPRPTAAPVPAGKGDPTVATPLIDRELAISRLGGNVALFDKLLPVFRSNLEKSAREMRAALERSAHEEMCRLMHTLKGMAASLGAVALASAAARAETQLRTGEDVSGGPATREVAQALEDTLRELG